MATAFADATPSTFKMGDSQVGALALGDTVFWQSFQPSGMTKNGTQAWTNSATYASLNNWTANTGTYPGSSVDGSHRLVVQGSKTGATITAQVPYTGSAFAQAHTIRCVNQSGTIIGSASSSVTTAPNGTVTLTLTGVDLTGITAVGVQTAGGLSPGTVSSGAGTYLTIT